MATSGARPPERGTVAGWTSFQVARGNYVEGWIAGPAVCVLCHVKRGSKPCLKRYAHENAPCDLCKQHVDLGYLYYLPWYRQPDTKPCISVFHENQRDALELVEQLEYVRIGRVDEDNQPHYLQRLTAQREFKTADDSRRKAQDVSDYLPTLWRMKGAITGAMVRRGVLPGMELVRGADGPRPDLADNIPDDFGKPAQTTPLVSQETSQALKKNRETVNGLANGFGHMPGDDGDRKKRK